LHLHKVVVRKLFQSFDTQQLIKKKKKKKKKFIYVTFIPQTKVLATPLLGKFFAQMYPRLWGTSLAKRRW